MRSAFSEPCSFFETDALEWMLQARVGGGWYEVPGSSGPVSGLMACKWSG